MRDYTREVRRQVAQGRVAVRSIGTPERVVHEPRTKNDPQPWTDGVFRYTGREVHTLPACREQMFRLKTGQMTECIKPVGHKFAHSSR